MEDSKSGGPRPARATAPGGLRLAGLFAAAMLIANGAVADRLEGTASPASAGAIGVAAVSRGDAMSDLVDQLLDSSTVVQVELAPDGRHLAAIVFDGRLEELVIIDSHTLAARILVAPEDRPGWTAPIQPLDVRWMGNDRVVADFNTDDCLLIPIDGRKSKRLGRRCNTVIDEHTVLVSTRAGLFQADRLRVNVDTGDEQPQRIAVPGTVVQTLVDAHGRLRFALTKDNPAFDPHVLLTAWYRHDEESPWRRLEQRGSEDFPWRAIALDSVRDQLVVLSSEGRDTQAVRTFDVASGRLTDVLAASETVDLHAADADASDFLPRVRIGGLVPGWAWMDERWARWQGVVDRALPDTLNTLSGSPDGVILVFASSSVEPGHWWLLDTKTSSLRQVIDARPKVERARQRPMSAFSYPSFDNRRIPAYLTLPSDGARGAPLVVYVHGGPVTRDDLVWDATVQLMAQAGYAVFQPQFRGSFGFGRGFERAGYRQWGLAMQDDITAGVRWLVQQGVADPNRVCIVGASYGGYAALWGLEKTPELYRCGVSLAGVSDIAALLSEQSDVNLYSVEGRWLQRLRIGDPQTMHDQFDATSPILHADRIRAPVLLAHGTDDERVPIAQSYRMEKALRAAGKDVSVLWMPHVEHGFAWVRDERRYDLALLEFLDRWIGPVGRPAATVRSEPAPSP